MWRLPEALRPTFQTPFGPVLQTADLRSQVSAVDFLICVGDHVSKTAIELGLHPQLIIVDFKTQRGEIDAELKATLTKYGKTVLRVPNEAATISNELYLAVIQGLRFKGPVRVEVDGEEDLAGLAVLAEAPEGAVMIYGMPNQGVVLVRVDAAVKARARGLLDQMREP